MTDKITSFIELKKAIKNIDEYKADIGGVRTIEFIERKEALDEISKFEASVRERIKSIQTNLKVKDYPCKTVSIVVDEAILEELEKELHRILEGEVKT